MAVACGLILARNSWEQTDVLDERKVFAQEVFGTLRTKLSRFARNGVAPENGDATPSLISRARSDRDNSEK